MRKENVYIIPELDNLEDYIKLANEKGLHFEYNDFYIPDELDNADLISERIAKYNSEPNMPRGNTMHGSFLDVTIFSSDKVIREHSEYRIKESLEIATKLGVKAVVIHTNYIPNFVDEFYLDNWVDMNARFIRKMLDEYPDISIYMENMFDQDPTTLRLLADELYDEKRFGICFDYAHACVFGTVDTLEWITVLGPYIKHIHINDNDLIRDQHLALGDGQIDFDEFFECYEKYFSDATLLLEVRGMEKIKKSLEYIGM